MSAHTGRAAGQPMEGPTRRLCAGLLSALRAGLPPGVVAEARRGILNVAGCAVAGSRTEAVGAVLKAADRLGPPGDVPVPGRRRRTSAPWAILAAGTAAHVDDFDDTRLETVVRPGAATFAALLPLAASGELDGRLLLDAFAVGVEAQLRVALAMSPWHFDEGWDITGTVGVLGAAVAVGVALGLDEDGLMEALGIAASTTLGTREGFGTMIEPFHVGKAAANGWLAAQLAQRGFTGSRGVLEAPRGYLSVLSPSGAAPQHLTDGVGQRWAMLDSGPARPLSDVELDGKVVALVELVLPDAGPRVCRTVRALGSGGGADDMITAMLPVEAA